MRFLAVRPWLVFAIVAAAVVIGPTPASAISIRGSSGADVLRGTAAGDTVAGLAGDDRLYGLRGNDLLIGGSGSDILEGGAGNDVLQARDGARDTVKCGPGRDKAIVDSQDVLFLGCEVVLRLQAPPSPPPPPPPSTANVVVESSGAYSVSDKFISLTQYSWGLVLLNQSSEVHAFDVGVTASIVDASNRVLASASDEFGFIAPGERVYMGATTFVLLRTPAAHHVEAAIFVRDSGYTSTQRPPVANVQISPFQISRTTVRGEFSNVDRRTLHPLTHVSAVIFDAVGNVLGGGIAFPVVGGLPSGARAGFEIQSAAPGMRAAFAYVTVNPRYFG